MLDIQFIRDNADLVAEKSKQKGYDVDVSQLLQFDEQRRKLLGKTEEVRARRNKLNESLKGKPGPNVLEQGKRLRDMLASLEKQLEPVELQFRKLLKQVPNMPLDDVPVGTSEADNKVVKKVGVQRDFDFKPKTHWELAEGRGLIDKERAAKVAGSRFAYLKGGLVELQFAVIHYVLHALTSETILEEVIRANRLDVPAKPFVPVLPPAMLKTDVYEAMDRLEPRDERYRVGENEDDIWLQGSAEHVLGSMYQNEILQEEVFPIRYIGYTTSFRREAGSYGKDTEGIFRMHQFDKLEMEVFSTSEAGIEEHKLLVALQEHMMQQLELPYRLINKCTADIGKPNARGIDIDTWMPGQGNYRETHTADYMTDYQARRLMTRVRRHDGTIELVHTNDATAFALGRILIAIIENYQTHDGHIGIPGALKSYMGNQEFI